MVTTLRIGSRRRQIWRRRALALAALIGLPVLVIAAWPLATRVIEHFELPLRYAPLIRQQATAKHLDPALIAAVIYAETRFRPRTSPTGAEGLMQIEPATARFLARRSGGFHFRLADLDAPAVNIAYGAYYLRYLLNTYSGSMVLALAAYNGGETNVDAWLASARAEHRRFAAADIPLSQTRAYVSEVLSEQRAYRRRYARQLGYSG
jgi:soluble lytic murein transglycosylase